MREPLVAPMAALAAGILTGRLVSFTSAELLLAIAGFLALGALALSRGARPLAGTCCLLGLLSAGALVELANQPGPPPELDAEGPVTIAGCVVEPPALSGERQRFVLELEPGARAQVTLYLREGQAPPRLDYGNRVELDARVRRVRNFQNPGSFDYARYLARRQIFWTAAGNPDGLRPLPGTCGTLFEGAVARLRAAALGRIERLYHGRPYETGMMQAILIGQSFQLQRVWTEHFRSTGTFHALVISGTHVAVLAAFLLLLLRLCFVPRGAATLVAVAASWLYAVVTGWQAPCLRSAAGFTLFMIGGYFYRRRSVLNVVAAVALAFLVVDPEQLFEPSFQLSFLAVGFIAVFALPLLEGTSAPLARGLAGLADTGRDLHLPPRVAQFRVEMRLLALTLRLWTRLPHRACLAVVAATARVLLAVFGVVALSALVQLGLALPMVIYFHRVGFTGLSANAFVVPLMGLVVPAGFVAVFTGWHWVAGAAALALHASRLVVDWHVRLEPAWRVPTPPLWLALAVAAALILAALALRAPRWYRLAAGAAVAILLILLVWHPFAPAVAPGRLEMTAIDVGQGDSLLVAFPRGPLMLVDGGGIPSFGRRSRTQLDLGEDVVSPYLWRRSIRRVDVLVCTHAHEDHIGGLPALLANFAVQQLWTGALPDTPATRQLRAQAARAGVQVTEMRRGRGFDFGGARIDVLAPAADYRAADAPRNNDSLALRLSLGRHAFVLSGDIERQVETELLVRGVLGRAVVLKVPHHGSRTSSTPAFLDALHPALAVLSAGQDNPYGHPHPDVVARYAERRIGLLRTDRDGLITVASDGRRLRVDTARWSGASLFRPVF